MAVLRSMLFIPADSEKKLAKGDEAGADALILDLEDSVVPANKARAVQMVAAFLRDRPVSARRGQVWVRINPLESGLALGDLAGFVGGGPDGIMLPKAEGPGDVRTLSCYLDALEVQAGLALGGIGIIPVATETAGAAFRLGEYATAGLSRLTALTWGAEDLATALGASTNRDVSGGWAFTYRMVRSMTLMAAHVGALETLYADFRDEAGLRAACREARAEGFTGRLAIHPAQVGPINECFRPSADEVAHAERVIAAFAQAPGAGTVGLDGTMLDIPHLKQAQAVLAQVQQAQQ
jgi:citrate lyase subunit beta/citryl-CoA lyase